MLAAVDTNFLLALADNDDDARDALDTLKGRAPHLLISATPTPLEELRFFKKQATDAQLEAAATKALASFKNIWAFRLALLTPSQQDGVRKIADQLRVTRIL